MQNKAVKCFGIERTQGEIKAVGARCWCARSVARLFISGQVELNKE